MSIFKRKILFLTFLLIFIIATPLISLYATGYKIGNGFKIQKTGILVIDTKPEGAKIYIDGKLQVGFFDNLLNKNSSYIRTPAKIKNIKPGEYTIKLQLDDYWSWEKRLSISSGKSTFIEDINLFKNDSATLINNNAFDKVSFSNNKKLIAASLNFNTVIINTESGDYFQISSTTVSTSSNILGWDQKSKYIVTDDYIVDIKNKKTILSIKQKIGNLSTNIQWINDHEIVYQNNLGINKYNIKEESLEKIIELDNIDDFLVKNNDLFVISNQDSSTSLIVWNIKEKEEYRKINLPKSKYYFSNNKHSLLNVHDKNHDILYLIDPFSHIKPVREVISNITLTEWINDSKLLYTNNFEIWILDLENYNKTLLTRISKKIKNIIWHPSNNYVIFSTNKSIYTIELDDREKRNITTLLDFDEVDNLEINQNGNVLIFYGSNDRKFGIYKLLIQ